MPAFNRMPRAAVTVT